MHAPLFIDVAGTALTDADRRRLLNPLVGGLTLFSRNGVSHAQLGELTASIHELRADLLIAVDHEGGRVQRFGAAQGLTPLPSMREIGRLNCPEAAFACGALLAAELRATGIDLSFAPVLDLDWGHSRVIGDRALAGDPDVVARLAGAFIGGMKSQGMAHCAKHFPGHGWVRADSHRAVPRDRRALDVLLRDDVEPYRRLIEPGALSAVMAAHVIYPRVSAQPAGFSRRWLHGVLRGRLGFRGAIFSDDLSMRAARVRLGRPLDIASAAVAALDAGCDAVLICNQSLHGGANLDRTLDELTAACDRGTLLRDEQSAARLRALRPTGDVPTAAQLENVAAAQRAAWARAVERVPGGA